jgi:hypothetical protein
VKYGLYLVSEREGKRHLEDIHVDGRIVLKGMK